MVNPNKPEQAGYTLTEVMIVVAIVGVLAVIGVPTYNDHVTRSNRADAKGFVQDIAQRLQRCMGMYGAYNNANCAVAVAGNYPLTSEEGMYEITKANGFDNLAATTFTLTATPVAGGRQAGDGDCASFTLTNTGLRSALDGDGNATDECW